MARELDHIVVLGGGTAGWITANILNSWRQAYPRARITVVESDRMGIVGTGEGATLTFRNLLRALEVDELDFIRETGATYKLGIEFEDWRALGASYLNPFNNLAGCSVIDAVGRHIDVVTMASIASGAVNATQFNVQCELMRAHGSPHVQVSAAGELASIEGVGQCGVENLDSAHGWGYSFHFDGHRVGAFFKRIALERGVRCCEGRVVAVRADGERGCIQALSMESGEELEADFFIDCSGFQRLLIGKHYRTPWRSYRSFLLNNGALPFQLPRAAGAPVPSRTLSKALSAGWMWMIPLQHRTGCGYVYNRDLMDPDRARRELESVLGCPIECAREIAFDSGRFERHWVKNCVAVGLASNFSEPLEATSIHATILQAQLLASYLGNPFDEDAEPVFADYNRLINDMLDDIRDFICLHYRSEREDTEYWRALKHDTPVPPTLEHQLALWRHKVPSDLDFPGIGRQASFTTVSYTYVLDGLKLLNPKLASYELARSGLGAVARDRLRRVVSTSRRLAKRALSHADFLERTNDGRLVRLRARGGAELQAGE